MTTEAKASVKKKHKLYRRWRENTADGQAKQEYKRVNNQAKWACRKAVKQFEKRVAKNYKSNPKSFWSYIRSKLKTKTSVADLDREVGSKTETDAEKAEHLVNTFFHAVFTKENLEETPKSDEEKGGLSATQH